MCCVCTGVLQFVLTTVMISQTGAFATQTAILGHIVSDSWDK